MLIDKKVKVKWNSRNKSFYIQKGYPFTKMGDEFEIKIEDITKGSRSIVNIVCDYCLNPFTKPYNMYYRQCYQTITQKDSCKKCLHTKNKESCMTKYGTNVSFQAKEVKQKIKNTNIEKYGYECASQSEEVKQRTKETNLERYGFESHLSNQDVIKKREDTNLQKYGVKNVFQAEEVKQTIKETMISKYGVEKPIQNIEIQQKAMEKRVQTLYQNGTAPASNQQKYLNELLGGNLNYPLSRCSLDIAFPDDMIYIEYNGSGHDIPVRNGKISKIDFELRDLNRFSYNKKQGWKLIKIVSQKDLLPTDEKIIEMVSQAKDFLNLGNSWYEINIDDSIIKSSSFTKSIKFEYLRKIKKLPDILDDDYDGMS